VIVIDEIGTELEALAARTIAERGVQLVGTAHGHALENLLVNPTLSDLIGGIQAVTLGDEEARRRGTQKTVLERKAPPTFDVLVEIQNWDQVIVYGEVAEAVDSLLRGEAPPTTRRFRGEDGQVQIETPPPRPTHSDARLDPRRDPRKGKGRPDDDGKKIANGTRSVEGDPTTPQRIFPFGVNRNRLEDAIHHLHVPATIVQSMDEATLVMTIKNYYRRSSQRLRQAESQGLPVYVIRNNTIAQMERQLAHIFQLQDEDEEDDTIFGRFDENGAFLPSYSNGQSLEEILMETEVAIEQLISGERDVVEMSPQNSYVRRLQHQLADRYNLRSKSRGDEPYRRVRIYS
jgi:hypothetical protein